MIFANILLSSVDLSIPEIGTWSARVRLAEGTPLVIGKVGRLDIGSLALTGTVVEGGEHVGRADYRIVGGLGGWRREVEPRSYRADNGVKLHTLLEDLAEEVGEQPFIDLENVAIGAAWTRPRTTAGQELQRLGVPWWPRYDGQTVFAPRPGGPLIADSLTVRSYDPTRRTAVIGVEDDELAKVEPARVITADGVSGLRIEHVRIVASPGSTWIEVGPHPERVLLEAFLARVEARTRFFGMWPYQVTEQVGARLTLKAEPLSTDLPGLVQIDKAHGIGGAAEELPAGAVVLVGWKGGDPSTPFVAHILSGTPKKASLTATERIDVVAPAVRVGDSGHKAVARVDDAIRVDPKLGASPSVQGGGIMYNPSTQSLVVVPPGNPAAVYLPGIITSGSAVLSSK